MVEEKGFISLPPRSLKRISNCGGMKQVVSLYLIGTTKEVHIIANHESAFSQATWAEIDIGQHKYPFALKVRLKTYL